MHVVVVGGSTQLGGVLLWRLIGQRKVKSILAVDSIPPAAASPKLKWTIAHPTDPGLERHCENADAVIYAGFVEPNAAARLEAGPRIVTDAARVAVPTLIGISSCLASSDDTDAAPALERALDATLAERPSTRVVKLRPGFMIGREIPDALGRALRARQLPKVGECAPPVVWDDDVADAAVLALFGQARGAYALAAEPASNIEALAAAGGFRTAGVPRLLEQRSGRVSSALVRLARGLPRQHAWMRATREPSNIDTERARSELGWQPSCATAEAVMRRFGEEVPHRLDPRLTAFFRLSQTASRRFSDADVSAEARRIDLTVHLRISGPNGGDFTLKITQGKPKLSSGVPRPLDAVIHTSADTLLELLSGKLDVATARFGGKVRIQGEPLASFVIVGLVTNFRRVTAASGARGWTARRLERWFARGA